MLQREIGGIAFLVINDFLMKSLKLHTSCTVPMQGSDLKKFGKLFSNKFFFATVFVCNNRFWAAAYKK